jgi:hypothetical protein
MNVKVQSLETMEINNLAQRETSQEAIRDVITGHHPPGQQHLQQQF